MNLRLVALGHSNAGKTTYLSSMYAQLATGYKGFTLRDVSEEDGHDLLRAGRAVRRGVYPPISSRRTDHRFLLTHGRRDVAAFDWTDYRGGSLTSTAADDPETTGLLARLTRADGLIVFADAQRLAADVGSHEELRRTVVLLQRAVQPQSAPLPIVLAFTKADLVTDPAAWALAREATAPLADLIAGEERILDLSVAVSCGSRPAGVLVPVLWCLSGLLTHRVQAVESELADSRRLIKETRTDAHAVNSMVSWLKGVESATAKLKRYEECARIEKEELGRLRRPAQRLARVLARVQRGTVPPVGDLLPAEAR
ncbi:hypothetical protein ACFVYP_32665 [Kitasatospora sp. NPDC058201]|uniref:TRAFAC clade GTPase domain-containing protein n=1 Tax=unclassified Kitasatospora TaxID=2633591 RepID=UPI00366609E1